MELQARLHEADPDLTIIVMTGYASVDTAVQALKRGAYDYITKPVDPDELSHLVANALEHKRARTEVGTIKGMVRPAHLKPRGSRNPTALPTHPPSLCLSCGLLKIGDEIVAVGFAR